MTDHEQDQPRETADATTGPVPVPTGESPVAPERPTAVFSPELPGAGEPRPSPPSTEATAPSPTLRYDPTPPSPALETAARATARFEPQPATPEQDALLQPGEWVADRYRVEAGPISRRTGEAEIYRCLDTVSGEFRAVKLYHPQVRPKEDVLEHLLLLRHPSIVALRDYGCWKGRFFEVMDYCAGGSLDTRMPFTEERLTAMLPDIAQGLRFLHNAGIIHRDIKPSNLFFRDAEGTTPVIGDFGISSKLEGEENVRRTSTAQFMTLDYAAPELIDGKEVSEKTDYYALGITLLHLLTGKSPFQGMDIHAILGCHFRGRVPRPDGLSSRFGQLLDGLLRVDPETRWGYAQVSAWLRREPVVTDQPETTVSVIQATAGRRIPYRSCPSITTPRELALNLEKFDAARDMRRGYISQWLMLFDEQLGQKVATLEEQYYDQIELGLFALKYLLLPGQPLVIGEHQVRSVAELAALVTRYPHISDARELEKAFQSGALEVWIRSLPAPDNTPTVLAAQVAALRKRQPRVDTALFALRFILDPQATFTVGNTRVTDLASLAAALSSASVSPTTLLPLIRTGKLLEWLRLRHPDKQAVIRAVETVARDAETNPAYAIFCLRCMLDPGTPMDALGIRGVKQPADLVRYLDADPSRLATGIQLLEGGWLRAWLVHTGRMKNPEPLDTILNDPTISWTRKLEAVLWLLQPGLPRPVPMADVAELDGGRVGSDRWKPLRVTVFNGSRGTLCGTAWLDTESPGFIMASESFEGGPVVLTVYVSGAGLEPGSRHTARLVVNTNGGDLVIPVRFRVAGAWGESLRRAAGGGVLFAALFGVLRYLLHPQRLSDASRFPPPPPLTTLAQVSRDLPVERVVLVAFLLLMVLVSALILLIQARRTRRQEDFLLDDLPGLPTPRSRELETRSPLDEERDHLDRFEL
ncbi:MAG: protein kinase [Candidatus Hydrogenedentes bacterium]|nr:protein kinase [Candidatus Hydrogenedentota bacterium]